MLFGGMLFVVWNSRVGYKNCCFVHVALVPELGSPGEQKTKPTQHSVKQMRGLGKYPPCLLSCRSGAVVFAAYC